MPKPSYQETMGSWNRTNYNGYSPTTYESGTNIATSQRALRPISSNRVGWRNLPYPARSAPLNYSTSVQKSTSGSFTTDDYRIWIDGSGVTSGIQTYGTNGQVLLTRDDIDTQLINEAVYKAKAKLFDKLKGEGANLANALGERKQVANTVSSLLKTVAYTARDLRRGNISSAIRRMGGDPDTARALRKKDIANQWLSLQYGWKPILSDVYDLIQGLHHREMVGVTVLKAGASAMLVRKSTHSQFQHPIPPYPATGIRSSRATAKYMIRVRPNLSIAEPAALGFTNPLTVLWEVTPWSFVVDWAIPIGRYLEQLSATHGWYFYDGCITTTFNVGEAGGYSWSSIRTYPGYYIEIKRFSSEGGAGSWYEMQRVAISDFPIPDVPHFKNPFSAMHALNSIALLSQAFGRGKVYR